MPRKDPEAKRAYMREWYARPENRERTIVKNNWRRVSNYAGTCRNCGGPTTGRGPDHIYPYCNEPECKSVQLKALWKERGNNGMPTCNECGKVKPTAEVRKLPSGGFRCKDPYQCPGQKGAIKK